MFKDKELRNIVEAQAGTIKELVKVINNLTEKVNKLDEEIHPKYFGGK